MGESCFSLTPLHCPAWSSKREVQECSPPVAIAPRPPRIPTSRWLGPERARKGQKTPVRCGGAQGGAQHPRVLAPGDAPSCGTVHAGAPAPVLGASKGLLPLAGFHLPTPKPSLAAGGRAEGFSLPPR